MKQRVLFADQGPQSTQRTGIEYAFDVPFVAALASREKQIQQNYRPVIAVHKWFARRPGTLFRALILAEFVEGSLRERFFEPHDLKGILIADPFMGGGTPLLEANRLGCDVIGYDINPMAYWIVKQEIQNLNSAAYSTAASKLHSRLTDEIGHLYRTRCVLCNTPNASVKYFLWVKTVRCSECDRDIDLFPGLLLAENRRHPKNVLVCVACGELNEIASITRLGACRKCGERLSLEGPAHRNRCTCSHCGTENIYPRASAGPPKHRMFAIEYHCFRCRPSHVGRFFKKPDPKDLARFAEASERWHKMRPTYAPDDEIPSGDETDRLHRWGYKRYSEMFNDRQLLGLELICRGVADSEEEMRPALATNLSDLLRYQNMLCRYDSYALKSLDIFSVHGFPVGLIACESNILGITNDSTGTNIGSGGWSNITEKFSKAKRYCEEPFEITYEDGRKVQVPIKGEWIGDHREGSRSRQVVLRCSSSTQIDLPPASLDAVFTDPPYFSNVQYAELMDFCYVWLRRLLVKEDDAFDAKTTRQMAELTGNATLNRGLPTFTQGLSAVFSRMAGALKSGAPLVFTYHHNNIEAYSPLIVAVLDAGLACSATLPCPAEMGASIHINRTASSVVDTVFVCRSTGRISRKSIVSTPQGVAALVIADLERLRGGRIRPTLGDARCIAHGHLARLAIWNLRPEWDRNWSLEEKLRRVSATIESFGGASVENHFPKGLSKIAGHRSIVSEADKGYLTEQDAISF